MNSRYFSKKEVNTGRQPELDLLKALCVVGMIFTHVFLDLGKDVMPTLIDDYVTEFFGAGTFMFCMGVGMSYMRNHTPAAYLVRGFGLLTIGQFLNLMRNALPNLIAYQITGKNFFVANALLVLQSDILSFAGLAFLLIAVFRMLKLNSSAILAISVVMSAIALGAWYVVPMPSEYLVSQFLAYFIITDAEAYFPLLCYFIYVAFGLFVGGYYKRIVDKDALANRIMLIGFPVTVVYYAIRIPFTPFLPEVGTDLAYNMKPTPDAIVNCLFTLAFLALLYKVVKAMGGKLSPIVMHFSKYINNYYCIHYMFILPLQTILIATTGRVFPGKVLPIVYSFFVTFICWLIIELNEKHWHIHFATLKEKKMLVFVAVVWIATIAVTAYCYPRIEEYANIWNDYLLP